MRTDYDEVNLLGRGFVFIGSDLGDEKIDIGPEMVSQPWKNDGLLYMVLLHELGHVFGLSHNGRGIHSVSMTDDKVFMSYDFMGEQFPETILTKRNAKYFTSVIDPGAVFGFADIVVNCSVDKQTIAYFGLPAGYNCIQLQRGTGGGQKSRRMFISAVRFPGDVPLPLGEMIRSNVSPGTMRANMSVGVNIFITDKQRALHLPLDQQQVPQITIPMVYMIQIDGSVMFKDQQGVEKPIWMTLNPRTFSLTGLADNQLKLILPPQEGFLVIGNDSTVK